MHMEREKIKCFFRIFLMRQNRMLARKTGILKKLNWTEIGTTPALYIPLTNLSSFYDCIIQLLSQFPAIASFRRLVFCIVIRLMLLISHSAGTNSTAYKLSAYISFSKDAIQVTWWESGRSQFKGDVGSFVHAKWSRNWAVYGQSFPASYRRRWLVTFKRGTSC